MDNLLIEFNNLFKDHEYIKYINGEFMFVEDLKNYKLLKDYHFEELTSSQIDFILDNFNLSKKYLNGYDLGLEFFYYGKMKIEHLEKLIDNSKKTDQLFNNNLMFFDVFCSKYCDENISQKLIEKILQKTQKITLKDVSELVNSFYNVCDYNFWDNLLSENLKIDVNRNYLLKKDRSGNLTKFMEIKKVKEEKEFLLKNLKNNIFNNTNKVAKI